MIRRAALLALLLSSPALARADEDAYAPLKALLGTWVVDRDCAGTKDRFLAVFERLPKTVVVRFQRDAKSAPGSMGRADVGAAGEEGRYRVATAVPDNPMLKAMNVKSVAGSLVVSTDESEDDALPNGYITCSSRVSVLSSLVTIRLKDGYRKATFLFNVDSPLGRRSCRGAAAKLPAPKKKP